MAIRTSIGLGQTIPSFIGRCIEGLRAHDDNRIANTVAGDLAFVTPARTMTKAPFPEFLRALYAGIQTGTTATTGRGC